MVSFGGVAVGEIGYAADLPTGGGARRMYAWGSAVYKSTDDGATWTTIDATSPYAVHFFEVAGGQDVVVIYDVQAGADRVQASTDGGATFGTVTAPRGGTPTPFDFVLCLTASHWLAYNSAEAYETTNGGSSWSDVSGTYVPYLYVQSSLGPAKIWSSDASDGSHATGTKLNYDGSGVASYAHSPGLTATYPISDSQALLFAGFTNVTAELHLVTGTTPVDITPAGALYWAAAASPDGTTICALGRDNGGNTGEIWRSTNGGSSWTQVAGPDALLYAQYAIDQALGVDRSDTTFWAVIVAGVGNPGYCWTSTDGGITWTQQGALPGGDIFAGALRVFGA